MPERDVTSSDDSERTTLEWLGDLDGVVTREHATDHKIVVEVHGEDDSAAFAADSEAYDELLNALHNAAIRGPVESAPSVAEDTGSYRETDAEEHIDDGGSER